MSGQAEGVHEVGASTLSRSTSRSGSGSFSPLRLVSRRWILATILVIIGMIVTARLGIWQLDRLQQRRAFNSRVQAQLDQPTLILDESTLDADLANMEYRSIVVVGEYDHSGEVALRNQVWGNQAGVHLLTPLKIKGTGQAILVDRGWVPTEDFVYGDWGQYAEPGVLEIQAVVRASRSEPDFGSRADPIPGPGERLEAWHFANVEGISQQLPYSLLPAYIQQAPSATWTALPYRTQPELDLSEGPHMGYAIQWFTFAAILGIGYPFFVRRQERKTLGRLDNNGDQ
ncbi:MAG: SURF1 family protein [Anaerolineales bacterium]